MSERREPKSLRSRVEVVWLIAGAVLGGFIVGPFRLEPGWAWGMGGGLMGGALGALAGWLWGRRWPWPLRLMGVAAVLGAGFFLLWLAAGRQWILTPRSVTPQ